MEHLQVVKFRVVLKAGAIAIGTPEQLKEVGALREIELREVRSI
jgi:hypothetical protein